MSVTITTELVKELRDATGISVMQCRRALEEAEGDINKALAILKKTSSEVAMKKKDREVKDGAVVVKTSPGKAVLLAVLCETDFVAKNDDFKELLETLGNLANEKGIEFVKTSALEMINPMIQKTGENIQLGDLFEVTGQIVGSYVHNGKKAVIVSLEGGNDILAKDLAMHIAAMNPEYITREEITEENRKMMQEVFTKEVAESDKSEDVKKKILEGKISTYFKEKTLLDQSFIKDAELTIEKLLMKNQAKIKEVRRYSI